MRDIGHEIVPDRVARAVQGRVGLDVGRHVERADGEGDDGGVALRHELVLGEALDVQQEAGGQRVQQAVALAGVEVFLGFEAVVFGEDGG